MTPNDKNAGQKHRQGSGDWTRQARVPRQDAGSDPDATQYTQYDQYGNPLDDGFGYTPEMEDFVYDGTDDSGYGVPIDPDVYAASQAQEQGYDPAGYQDNGAYQDGGAYQDVGAYRGQPGGAYQQAPSNQDAPYGGAGYDYQYDGGGYQYYPEPGQQRRGGLFRGHRRGGGQGDQRPPKRRHVHKGLIAFLVVLAAIVGLYLVTCGPIDQQLAFESGEAEGLSEEESLHIPGVPYYVLALGSDAREGDTASRTDTMILCRIDPIASKVTLVSIPRDTKVELEGYGTSKINAAYAYGGATLATKAVSDLTGVNPSHVAVIHFDQLAQLIDAIGGITVTVPVDVNDPNYTGLVMSAGTYEMDGNTALLFSRVRHGFATGDFQRQADQQIVIQAVLQKILSLGPTQIGGFMDEIGDVVSTDMKMYSILPLLLRFKITSPTIYACSLPGEAKYISGVSYVVSDDTQVRQLMAKVDAGQDPNASSSNEAAASNGSLSSAQ